MLEVHDLAARRGHARLFEGLSFAVGSGRALIVTGANGTGKTTLLRMLAGLTLPAAGEIRWKGKPIAPFDPGLRAAMAFVGHAPALKDELTAEENLWLLVALSGETISAAAITSALESVSPRVAPRIACARSFAGTTAARRPCTIGAARPAAVDMDEPATALDAAGSAMLAEIIGAHLDRGGVAVAATHGPLGLPQAGSNRSHSDDRRSQGADRTPTRRHGGRGVSRPALGARTRYQIALRSRAELAVQLLFYVIVVTLFPLATTPERTLLAAMGPGVLWVAALLASLLSLPRLFTSDYADGTLEQIALSPYPLEAIVAGKVLAHWLTTGFPVVLLAPLSAFNMRWTASRLPCCRWRC
jgi:heme ABC exporter ATP-binding subunit CcmA